MGWVSKPYAAVVPIGVAAAPPLAMTPAGPVTVRTVSFPPVSDEELGGNRERIGAKDPKRVEGYAHGDLEFTIWLKRVDKALGFVSHRVIADWTWRGAYDDGVDPSEAAVEALATGGLELGPRTNLPVTTCITDLRVGKR